MGTFEQPQLTISMLIQELVRLQQEQGDLPVVLIDADTLWEFKLKAGHLAIDDKYLKIEVNYQDEELTR